MGFIFQKLPPVGGIKAGKSSVDSNCSLCILLSVLFRTLSEHEAICIPNYVVNCFRRVPESGNTAMVGLQERREN